MDTNEVGITAWTIPKTTSDWLVKRNALSWRQSARTVVTSNV